MSALGKAQLYELIVELQRRGLHVYNPDESQLVLAQLPETCGICDGNGELDDWYFDPCPKCNRTGKVYPAELVERIAEALLDHDIAQGYMLAKFRSVQRPNAHARAVAVLDALNSQSIRETS